MEKIPNLVAGSRLVALIADEDTYEVKDHLLTLTERNDFLSANDNNVYQWEDIGLSPREAVCNLTQKIRCKVHKLQQEISKWETILSQRYPLYPVFSEEEFKTKFPNLSAHLRMQDYAHKQLEEMQRHKEWEADRYNRM